MWNSGTATHTLRPAYAPMFSLKASASKVSAFCEICTALGWEVVPEVNMMKAVAFSSEVSGASSPASSRNIYPRSSAAGRISRQRSSGMPESDASLRIASVSFFVSPLSPHSRKPVSVIVSSSAASALPML